MTRFKIDENLPVEICELLIRMGHDAHSVYDEQLTGARDETLYAICKQEKRVLVTLDLDFSDVRSYPPASSPGIIVLRVGNQSKKQVVKIFNQAVSLLETHPIENRLWIAEEQRVRIRGEEQD